MVIRAIFFDFDGTILDSWDLIAGVFERVLREFGVEYGEEDLRMLGMRMGKILGKLGVEKDKVDEIGDRFFEVLEEEVRVAELKSCCDLDVLRELGENFAIGSTSSNTGVPSENPRRAGIDLVIVSNARREYIEIGLEKLGIRDLFSRVVGADVGGKDKDEIVVGLIEEMGLERDEVVYVGDRFSDVMFARKAGVRVVAVSNGCSWSSREELEAERPDFLIGDLGELERAVGKMD